MAQLDGRTVFITGSGGVLGSTYVRRMPAAGAKVVAKDLLGHRLGGLQAAHGDKTDFAINPLDVSSEAQVVELFMTAQGDGRHSDRVHNNAPTTGGSLRGGCGTE